MTLSKKNATEMTVEDMAKYLDRTILAMVAIMKRLGISTESLRATMREIHQTNNRLPSIKTLVSVCNAIKTGSTCQKLVKKANPSKNNMFAQKMCVAQKRWGQHQRLLLLEKMLLREGLEQFDSTTAQTATAS